MNNWSSVMSEIGIIVIHYTQPCLIVQSFSFLNQTRIPPKEHIDSAHFKEGSRFSWKGIIAPVISVSDAKSLRIECWSSAIAQHRQVCLYAYILRYVCSISSTKPNSSPSKCFSNLFCLPMVYQRTTNVLPTYYQRFTNVLSTFYQCTTNVLPTYYQRFTNVLTTFYQRTTYLVDFIFFTHTAS